MPDRTPRDAATAARTLQRVSGVILLMTLAGGHKAAAQRPNIGSGTVRTANSRPRAGGTSRCVRSGG